MTAQSEIPVVALYNNLETFFKFLKRSSNQIILEQRTYRGDRGIFWLGKSKLLVVTKAIPHAEYICRHWGYAETQVVAPQQTTYQLSLDIMRDPDLVQKIVAYAGPQKTIQLIPYATTPELYRLANYLCDEFGLTVLLPESPTQPNLWIRDYIDTKAGFRSLAPQYTSDKDSLIPPGFACRNAEDAARAVLWFNQRQLGAVVKADGGESGIGNLVFRAGDTAMEDVLAQISSDPYLNDDLIVVDQLIESETQLSPSLELFVPATGAPAITYVSRQLFSAFGRFAGVLISNELTQSKWYPRLAKNGLQIAARLQALGYVGHFDIDAIIDDQGRTYLLEINARRTGGTYVHEFATMTFGKDYLQKVALLCNNSVKCNGINQLEDLLKNLQNLLYPIAGTNRGVVITVTSSLAMAEFGCILIAQSEKELFDLNQEMLLQLETHSSNIRRQWPAHVTDKTSIDKIQENI